MSIVAESLVQIYVGYKLIKLLSAKFEDWDAFKLGLIDEKGNLIRKPSSVEEKKAYGMFESIIRKIKVIMNKFIGQSRMAAVLATLYLLKDHVEINHFLSMLRKHDAEFDKALTERSLSIKDRFNRIMAEGTKTDALEPGSYKFTVDDVDGAYKQGDTIVFVELRRPVTRIAGVPLYEISLNKEKLIVAGEMIEKVKS